MLFKSPKLWSNALSPISGYYDALCESYPGEIHAVGWLSQHRQRCRFQVLLESGIFSGASVLDVGSGLGDLLTYMDEKNLQVLYTGLDMSPKMVAYARSQFPEKHFILGSILDWPSSDTFDFVVASGIMGHRLPKMNLYAKKVLKAMYARAKKAVAINFLSSFTPLPERASVFWYPHPQDILKIALSITPRVVLRQEYLDNDFTVYLYPK